MQMGYWLPVLERNLNTMPIYKGAILSNPSTLSNDTTSVMCKVFSVDGQKIPATHQAVINLYDKTGALSGLAKSNRVSFEAGSILEPGANDKPLPAREDKPELMVHRIAGFKPETLVITQARKALDLGVEAAPSVTKAMSKAKAITPAQKQGLIEKAFAALGFVKA